MWDPTVFVRAKTRFRPHTPFVCLSGCVSLSILFRLPRKQVASLCLPAGLLHSTPHCIWCPFGQELQYSLPIESGRAPSLNYPIASLPARPSQGPLSLLSLAGNGHPPVLPTQALGGDDASQDPMCLLFNGVAQVLHGQQPPPPSILAHARTQHTHYARNARTQHPHVSQDVWPPGKVKDPKEGRGSKE